MTTDEEKERLREAKNAVSERLAQIDLRPYALDEVDSRLLDYCSEVASNPEGHNLFEQLAVERFLRLVDKYGLSVGVVRQKIAVYESLHFPGKVGVTCYAMTPVQVFQFAHVFGFWSGGQRVVRNVLWFVPRKFSKTTSAAFFVVDDVLFGDSNAESYTCANSADQAKKCFAVVRGCFRKLDPKERRYVNNETEIKSRRPDRPAFAQCLTANANTKDGLNASTVIMDEYAQARDSDLLNVLTTSMGVRDNPLTVIITTASNVLDGPCFDKVEGYKKLLLGEYEDDASFGHLFMPDVDDDEGDEATWRKVHPHMGVTVSMDFYREQWSAAQREGAESLMAFRTKLLNIYAEIETRSWISSTLARRMMRPESLQSYKTRPQAMVAIDLSISDDFSAVTAAAYDREGKGFRFDTSYFFPEGALKDHPNEKLYRKWAADGHLILTDGPVIDYRAIVRHVMELSRRYEILGIGYDPYKSQEVINMLAAAGGDHVLTPVRQTYGTFTAPVESFEHMAKTDRVTINANPINAYCFGNAVLDYDKLDNCKPLKRRHNQKIDGVITMLMCLRLFLDYEQ